MSSLAIRSDLFKGSLFSRLLLTWSSPKVIGLELHPLGQLNMWGSLLEEFFFSFFLFFFSFFSLGEIRILEQLHQLVHKIPFILHLKPTFSILHHHFYKIPTSVYLFYKIFH